MAASPFLPDQSIAHIEAMCSTAREGRRASRLLSEWLEPLELAEAEFQVLWHLRTASSFGIDQKTLAQCLALSPAQVSVTVERVRQRGWIAACEVGTDRRRHAWRLSEAGRNLLVTLADRASELAGEGETSASRCGAACVRREAAA